MTTGPIHVGGMAVYAYDGPVWRTVQDALDVLGSAWYAEARLVAVPVSALDPSFFVLSSGLAGEIAQKYAQYGMPLAIIGDLSPFTAGSKPLRDFVRESNEGRQLWFAGSVDGLPFHRIPTSR